VLSHRLYSPVLSVQAYIWIQHFEKWKKSLGEGVEEMLATFLRAGYRNVDLNDSFFAAPLRAKTLGLLKKNGLAMPTLYANSVMYEAPMAEHSIKAILELAETTKPAGVLGIVTNPSPKPKQGRKSDDELAVQARYLNQLGGELKKRGVRLMVHHHTPELVENAREWRHQLANTDPQLVGCCVDLHWAYRGGQEPLAFLREVGPRLESLHLRNSRGGVWMEDFNDGDVNYHVVADYLKEIGYQGYVVVELAYEDGTKVTRSLEEDLRLSRLYTEKTFGLHQS
jgi:inosose dehydratase